MCFAQTPQVMRHRFLTGEVQAFSMSSWAGVISGAQPGDTIYLPGGTMNLGSVLNIPNRVHVFGAGHHPDSTLAAAPSVINFTNSGIATININGEKSTLTGIHFSSNLSLAINADSVEVTRCNFWQISMGSTTTGCKIVDNIFRTGGSNNYLDGNGSTGHLIKSNLLLGTTREFNNCFFYNNVIRGRSSIVQSMLRNNCISGNTGGFSNCFFVKNLFELEISLPDLGFNDGDTDDQYFPHLFSQLFLDYQVNDPYASDYHINPVYPGAATFLGDDGTTVGIYGGSCPSKVGWLPTNPHIFFKDIATELNPDGTLPVQVSVSAQGN